MKLEQVITLSYAEIVKHILDSRGLDKHPPPSNEVWNILPLHIVEFLACVRLRDIQVGDFIVSRVSGVEKAWSVAVERSEGEWIPIIIGSTEVGEGISVFYNQNEDRCIDPINLIKGRPFTQGEVVALNFDTFLRLNLILDTIKSERLIDEERGMLNSEGQQRLLPALELFYPNFAKSEYWNSWFGR